MKTETAFGGWLFDSFQDFVVVTAAKPLGKFQFVFRAELCARVKDGAAIAEGFLRILN